MLCTGGAAGSAQPGGVSAHGVCSSSPSVTRFLSVAGGSGVTVNPLGTVGDQHPHQHRNRTRVLYGSPNLHCHRPFHFFIDIDCPIALKRQIRAGSSHNFPTWVQRFQVGFLSLHLEKLGVFWDPSPLPRTHAQSLKYKTSKLPDCVCLENYLVVSRLNSDFCARACSSNVSNRGLGQS